MNTLKFFYNGIKAADGKLQRCHYSIGEVKPYPYETITIYARDYIGFNAAVSQEFKIENNSELLSDYNEKDCIRVTPAHPLYAEVLAAHEKAVQHIAKQYALRIERHKARRDAYTAARAAA